MSLCDFCHGEFFSKGVTALGVGTFCGHACKVRQIHQNAGLPPDRPFLHTYICPRCRPLKAMTTTARTPKPWDHQCDYCRSWMRYSWSEPITTDAQAALAARGIVYGPYQQPPQWTCVRCGEEHSGAPQHRPDGLVCIQCYHAEEHPPIPLRTPEEIEVHRQQRAAFLLEQDDRLEAAYRQKENH